MRITLTRIIQQLERTPIYNSENAAYLPFLCIPTPLGVSLNNSILPAAEFQGCESRSGWKDRD